MLDRQSTRAASTAEPQAVATSPIDPFDPGGRGAVSARRSLFAEQVSNGYSGSPATPTVYPFRSPASLLKLVYERLPELTNIYARRTTRCQETLTELGFALGGKAAAARSAQLGLQSSRMTILRMLRQTFEAAMPTPRMLGVDEFALRRGKKYGTILVNLENGVPVDLLPDRQAATLETWLKQHPGVLLISRDRAGEFARGAKA